MFILKVLLIGLMVISFTACSSGGDGGGSSDTTEESNAFGAIVTSGTTSSSQISTSGIFKIKNGNYLYNIVGCKISSLYYTDYYIYDSGIMVTSYTDHDDEVISQCYIDEVFKVTEILESSVNGAYVNTTIFYDENLKSYFLVDSYTIQDDDKLIYIDSSNIGTVEHTDGSTTLVSIEQTFKNSTFEENGMTKYDPINGISVYEDQDLMETGYYGAIKASVGPQVRGYLYYYDTSSCDYTSIYNIYYEVYRNGDFRTYSKDHDTFCLITDMYQKVSLSNGIVNVDYLDSKRFYDSETGIYYEHTSNIDDIDAILVEIINDGNNAVIQLSDSSRKTVQISTAYKKIV